jgi:hypothetical protein
MYPPSNSLISLFAEMLMKLTSLTSVLTVLALMAALAALPCAAAEKIKKCQDAEGRWHYGDNAAEECERSKITVIDERGQKVKEVEVPPSAEELAAEKAKREQAEIERERAEQQRVEDQRLLATYDSAQAIIRSRDERIAYFKSQMQINDELLGKLRANLKRLRQQGGAQSAKNIERTEAQIAEYEAANVQLARDLEEVTRKYNDDLARYQALTGQEETNPPAEAK